VEVLRSLKEYRDSKKLSILAKERVEELRKREQAEYNEMMTLASSLITSDVETALRLMKESDSPLLKEIDIVRCERRLKIARASETVDRLKVPTVVLGVVIAMIVVGILSYLNS
jgi:hypothetical protein